MDFYAEKETYARVYGLRTNEKNWEWQYLDKWVYVALLITTGLTVITLRLIKKDNQIIRKLNWAVSFPILVQFKSRIHFHYYNNYQC